MRSKRSPNSGDNNSLIDSHRPRCSIRALVTKRGLGIGGWVRT